MQAGEYDSEDIWACCCESVKSALAQSGIDPAHIRGISFDATCSLVLRAPDGAQLPMREEGDSLARYFVRLEEMEESVKIISRNDVKALFLKSGMEAEGNSPKEFAATIREEVDKWKKLVKIAGIKAQ